MMDEGREKAPPSVNPSILGELGMTLVSLPLYRAHGSDGVVFESNDYLDVITFGGSAREN